MIEGNASDLIDILEEVIVELTFGAYSSDSISVSDSVEVQLIGGLTDEIEVEDSVSIEASYGIISNDEIEIEEQLLQGDPPVFYMESVDGGIVPGEAGILSVSPTGPITMSGKPDCVSKPVGFVVISSDTAEVVDGFVIELFTPPEFAITIDGQPITLNGEYLTLTP